MDYVQFGRTGVRVSPLCLGCWNFGMVTDEAEPVKLIHRALDHGINFIDTANVYTGGVSEGIVAKALGGGKRTNVFLATKVRHPMDNGPNDWGTSRRHIMMQVEGSLKRLKTDWIDLYQLHSPDATTPIEESLRALHDLVHQGKVRYIGTSNYNGWQMCEGQWTSDRLGLNRFVSEQPQYSIFWRGIEREALPFALKYGIAVIPYSPLSGGWLSGKHRKNSFHPDPAGRVGRDKGRIEGTAGANRLELVEKLVPLAEAKGCSLSQFAIAWSLSNPGVIAPIIGPRTVEQLDDCVKALDVTILDEDRANVDAIVPPGTNVP